MAFDAQTNRILQRRLLNTSLEAPAAGENYSGHQLLRINLRAGIPQAEIDQLKQAIARWYTQGRTPVDVDGQHFRAQGLDINGKPYGQSLPNVSISSSGNTITIVANRENIDKSQQSRDYVFGTMSVLDREIRTVANPAPGTVP